MSGKLETVQLGTNIRGLLAGLRWRIRAYVWLEGLSLAIIWIGLTFWIGLAIDYFPVVVLASEIPWALRAVGLVTIATVLAWILFRWIVRRTFVPLADHSMALLLERRFHRLQDSLVTAVDMYRQPDQARQYSQEMLAHTRDEAQAGVQDVRLRNVFKLSPLMLKFLAAGVLIIPMGVFYAVNAPAFEIWVNRIYLLQDQPWPRSAQIEVVGIEVQQDTTAQLAVPSLVIPFENGSVKVAKGASVILKVRAKASARMIPDYCTVSYRTAEGNRGRVIVNRFRRVTDGYQMYTFAGKPFRGILSDMVFDVVGYDHRLSGFKIHVVDSPAVVETRLGCIFPQYMVDEESASWLPREVDYLSNGTRLPRGTDVTIRMESNKELQRVYFYNPETKERFTLELQGRGEDLKQFEHRAAFLDDHIWLQVTLHDVDNVISQRAHRVVITSVADEAPVVDTELEGIGSLVTPDVIMPAKGTITDDYLVDQAWFEVQHGDADPRRFPFPLQAGDQVQAQLDFRELRGSEDGLELRPKDKLFVTIKARDRYNLEGDPNEGSGQRLEIDVVTPDQLLAALEARELAQRRRLEHVVDEMSATRDSLSRFKADLATPAETTDNDPSSAGAEPDDQPLDAKEAAQRVRSLRLLSIQQAVMQSQKSSQEVLGIAAAFFDIVAELINNRVDTQDRRQRLEERIAQPLQLVGETMFPELDRRLQQVLKTVDQSEASAEASERAIEQAGDILVELARVLEEMQDIASFNELIDHVRALIEEQQTLIDATRAERKKSALDLLE